MYIYNYIHIWRAARNVKNPPANNYAGKRSAWTPAWEKGPAQAPFPSLLLCV